MKQLFTRLTIATMIVFAGFGVIPSGATVGAIAGDDVIFKNVCTTKGAKNESSVCKNQTGNPIFGSDGILIKVASIIAVLTGALSIVMMILGGIKLSASRGDANAVANARNTILAALVGVSIAFSAGAIIFFVIRQIN